jgi:hypothetical protein
MDATALMGLSGRFHPWSGLEGGNLTRVDTNQLPATTAINALGIDWRPAGAIAQDHDRRTDWMGSQILRFDWQGETTGEHEEGKDHNFFHGFCFSEFNRCSRGGTETQQNPFRKIVGWHAGKFVEPLQK